VYHGNSLLGITKKKSFYVAHVGKYKMNYGKENGDFFQV
jgi:hypothetical protein